MANILTPDSEATQLVARKFGFHEAKRASEIVVPFCLGIMGQGGAGKTDLTGTLFQRADGSRNDDTLPALVVDMQANPAVLPNYSDIYIVPENNWDGVVATTKSIDKAENADIKTVVLDNFSDMYMAAVYKAAGGEGNAVQIQNYNVGMQEALALAKWLKNRAESRGINVVFVLWETTEERVLGAGMKGGRLEPLFTNKMQGAFPGVIPFIGHLHVSDRPDGPRILDFRARTDNSAKWQARLTQVTATIPHELYVPAAQSGLLSALHASIKLDTPFPVAKYSKPVAAK